MITLLTGGNSYEIERELKALVTAFDGTAEKFDGLEIELRQLPDLLMGLSLFAEKRLVIVQDLASNKLVWEALPELVGRMSDDIHLVLVEAAPDKRTKTYKALQKQANVKEHKLWTERDSHQAERWIEGEAKSMGMRLDKGVAQALLRRSLVPAERGQPVIDQWQIMNSLQKLAVLEEVTVDMVEQYIDMQSVDNVFGLLETALRGDIGKVHQLLADLEPREDPFKVFGLLSSQVFQLATLSSTNAPVADVAKEIGVHPFAVSKLSSFGRALSRQDIKQIVMALTEADEALKLSKASPWTLIEQALMKVAIIARK